MTYIILMINHDNVLVSIKLSNDLSGIKRHYGFVCVNRGPSRVTLVMMGVCKSPDLPTYEISSISSRICALRDSIRAEGRRQPWREEEIDDCREPQRRVKKSSLP